MDALDRLYGRVVESLTHIPRQMEGVPVTIGELYQSVAPYRAVRAELGFAELAGYEHALLRFLSGERGYVSIEQPNVQDELRREMASPNPILGVYRDYAEVLVHVHPNVPVPAEAAPAAAAPEPWPEIAAHPAAATATAQGPPRREPAVATAPPPRPACPGCRSALPEGREARFCPFCGKCVKPIPCADCGEMVEPEWAFCVGCGTARPAGAAPRAAERQLR